MLVSMERYKDALQFYQTAFAVWRQLPGENDLCCATTNCHIGEIFYQLKDYDQALKHFLACLEIYKRDFGEMSEEVANISLSIGKIYDLQVDIETAKVFYFRALEIHRSVYGKDDVKVGETLHKIACVLEDWRDTDEVCVIPVLCNKIVILS